MILDIHPCGVPGGFAEVVVNTLHLNDGYWDHLPSGVQACMMMGAERIQMPKNWDSYQAAIRAFVWGGHGEVETFEKEIAEFLGVKKAYWVSTGTMALVAMIQAAGIGPGDEVVMPTFTWIATQSAVTVNGAIPVLAEVDETLGINPEKLDSYITPRTKAIMAVHMQGVPCNISAIRDVANRRGVPLIEDVAQAFGSSFHGKFMGTFGIMGMTSTNPSKLFHSGGGGGLVWTTDTEMAERLRWVIDNRVGVPKKSQEKNVGEQRILFAGHNIKPPNTWHAAFIRSELRHLPHTMKAMVELKSVFRKTLKPQYQAIMQRQGDPKGEKGYAIWMILKKNEHVKLLSTYLREYGIKFDTQFWKMHYVPNFPSFMKRGAWHDSGFPWITKEEQKPDLFKRYDVSNEIMNRTIRIMMSFHYTPTMMIHLATKINDGLDSINKTSPCY